MKRGLHLAIITTCTNQKRKSAPEKCTLESCLQGNVPLTIQKWLRNIQDPAYTRYSPNELYLGAHWRESQRSVEIAKQNGLDASLWVLSAGWGLVHSDQAIAPYSATFASGKDSVQSIPWPQEYSIKERNRHWWNAINSGRDLHKKCSLEELPECLGVPVSKLRIFVIASREYYLAIELSLLSLISRGYEVFIICAGLFRDYSSTSPTVRDFLLPFSDKFKLAHPSLNKTNVSLNARLANWILTEHVDDVRSGIHSLHKKISSIERGLSEPRRKDVIRLTDEEVLSFICSHYKVGLTATRLLRNLRDVAGKSCEQKRFGALFRTFERSYMPRGLIDE